MELSFEKSCCSAGNNQVDEQAGESPGIEEPGRLQSMGSQRVGYTELLSTAHTLLSHKKECILVCPNEADEPTAYYTQ